MAGGDSPPRPGRGELCMNHGRKGWGRMGIGECFLMDHRIALRTVVYIFPGAEVNLDNQEENKEPQRLRPKKLNFKSLFKG